MNNSATIIAGAIVIAGIFIAGAVVYVGGGGQLFAQGDKFKKVRVVDENDHVFGNPDAKITIIEYSDFECPFCARFHPTVAKIVEDFDGQVNWVYRHFPLNIHANAPGAALASECVAELGGNDAFWTFADRLFENQGVLGPELYFSLGEELGVAEEDLQACLESDRYVARVQQDLDEAISSGARGTPFSVVVNERGKQVPFSGALEYDFIVDIIESL